MKYLSLLSKAPVRRRRNASSIKIMIARHYQFSIDGIHTISQKKKVNQYCKCLHSINYSHQVLS